MKSTSRELRSVALKRQDPLRAEILNVLAAMRSCFQSSMKPKAAGDEETISSIFLWGLRGFERLKQ